MKSWRTTTLGVLAGVSLIVSEATSLLDNDPTTIFSLENVFAALAAFGIGFFARDNKVSSEEVGAKK